jgi:hypothetical protein
MIKRCCTATMRIRISTMMAAGFISSMLVLVFFQGAGGGANDPLYNNPDPYLDPDLYKFTQVFRFFQDTLTPDSILVHTRPLNVTEWESFYSSVLGDSRMFMKLAPVVDDSWRVVGHVGWIDGVDLCVPYRTPARTGSKFWDILAERRLAPERQQLQFLSDSIDRSPFSRRPAQPATMSPAPLAMSRAPQIWESEERRHKNNLNYFLSGGGKAIAGRGASADYTAYLDALPAEKGFWPQKYVYSSGYRFLVLVNPDGYLQAVLDVQKVEQQTAGERALEIAFEVIDVALMILMIVDIATIPVALFSLGRFVARGVMIRALEVTLDREAKAGLDLVMQRVRRELVGAMTGPEQAEARTAWQKLKQKFWDAGNVPPRRQFSADEAKQLNKRIADRMKELGIPKKNVGAGSKMIPPGAKQPRGKPFLIEGENGKAFNPSGNTRGGRIRSTLIDEYGGAEGGISIHGNVFDPWEGFDLWNDPTTLVEDRIDATIAHEWMEFNGLSHWETVEQVTNTTLPIRPRARELLGEMAKWGNSEKAFTEFTRTEWKAIVDAGKATASFDEKAAAAAAKAK